MDRSPARAADKPGVQQAGAITSRPARKENAKYDVIVVGAGAGGGPLAARAAEAGLKVLVLEGGVDKHVPTSEPLGLHGVASENKDLLVDGKGYFINHRTDESIDKKDPKYVDKEQGIFVPRGAGVGGSTRMNAGIFVRPDDVDWDNIAKITGDRSWSSPEMLKHFQKIENAGYHPVLKMLHMVGKGLDIEALQNLGGHGFDGWLEVNRPLDIELAKTLAKNPQLVRLLWETLKYNFTKVGSAEDKLKMLFSLFDPNVNMTNNAEGFVVTPLTVTSDGRRNGPRERLFDVQAKHPDRLDIVSGARVHSVILDENNEAVGVRYRTADGQLHEEPVKREVVLSAGAFETPAILMRSGIGPAAELEKLKDAGVDKKVVLEGVGQGLKGRYEVGVVTRLKKPLPILTDTEFNADPNNPAYARWKETGQGAFAANGIVAAFRVKSDPSQPEPNLYVFAVPGNFQGYVPGYSQTAVQDPNLVTWIILDENKGDTKGSVTLDPHDINGHPRINQMFHGDERAGDTQPIVDGIKIVRELAKRYGDLIEGEVWPGPEAKTDEQLRKLVEQNSWDHHPNGTAQMGPADDPMAVLDSKLRVHGTRGLRVSDASVFPRNMGSFIQSAIMTVAEKAASEIIEDARAEDARRGSADVYSPLTIRLPKGEGSARSRKPVDQLSPKNTLRENLFVARQDVTRLGSHRALGAGEAEAVLRELVDVTGALGFSKRELEEARAEAAAAVAHADPNAPVYAKLADLIAAGRADQGFLLDMQARLDDWWRGRG